MKLKAVPTLLYNKVTLYDTHIMHLSQSRQPTFLKRKITVQITVGSFNSTQVTAESPMSYCLSRPGMQNFYFFFSFATYSAV